MTTPLDTATQSLLAPVGLGVNDLQKTLDQLISRRIDQADLYFESSRTESWMLEDGIIKEGAHNTGRRRARRQRREDRLRLFR